MKASIKRKYQEFIDYIDFPTLIYVYETGKIIAINEYAKVILGEDCINMNSLWEGHSKLKLTKKILYSGSEILYSKCVNVDNITKIIDIEVNSIIIGKKHFIFCFFELSEKQYFIKKLHNQLPRILWKNTNLIFKGANNCCRSDINYNEDMYSICTNESVFDTEANHKITEDDNEVLINGENKYNVIQTIKVANRNNIFVKINRMPILDRNEEVFGVINVYLLILNREDNLKTLTSVVKENAILNEVINKSETIIVRWMKKKDWPIEYISPNISRYGYEPKDFYESKITWKDIVYPDDYERVFCNLPNKDKSFNGQEDISSNKQDNILLKKQGGISSNEQDNITVREYRIITDDDRIVWIRDEIIELFEDNSIRYQESIINDITTQKEMEKEIQASKRAFQIKMDGFILNNYNLEKFNLWDFIDEEEVLAVQNKMASLLDSWNFMVDKKGELITEPTLPDLVREDALTIINRKDSKEYYKMIGEECEKTGKPVHYSFYHDNIRITGIPYIIGKTYFASFVNIVVLKPLNDADKILFDNDIICFLKATVIDENVYGKLIQLMTSHINGLCNASYQQLELMKEKRFAEETSERLRLQYEKSELIASILQMIQISEADEDLFNMVLEKVADYTKVSRALLCSYKKNDIIIESVYDWNKNHSSIRYEKNAKLDSKVYYYIREIIDQKGYYIYQEGQENLECEDFFMGTDAKTCVSFRLIVDGNVCGFISFGDTRKDRVWSEDTICLLQDIVHIIENIIAKKRIREELSNSYKALEKVLNNIDNYVYVISDEDDTILFANNRMKQIYGENIIGKVYQNIFTESSMEGENYAFIKQADEYLKDLRRVDIYDGIHDKFFIAHYNKTTWIDNKNITIVNMYDVTSIRKYSERIQAKTEYDNLNYEKCKKYEKNLRKAINNGCFEFQVYYQPIFSGMNKKIVGAEAITEWHNPKFGVIKQDDFIPLAEYLELIDPLKEFTIKEAITMCKKWNDDVNSNFKVHINMSTKQLKQNNIVSYILDIAEKTGVNTNNIIIGIKERQSVDSMNQVNDILLEFREKGFMIALDYFGVGCASFNYLMDTHFNYIKLDKSIIQNYGSGKFNFGILSALIDIVHNVNMKLCIDGIETKQQLEDISLLPIDQYQGGYFGKPDLESEFYKKYSIYNN